MKLFSSALGSRRGGDPKTLQETLRPDGAWLFGKIPAHGDFIARGISQAAQKMLDDWLSGELAAARARFSDFDARYVHAAPWHFVDCDPTGAWSGGALCLSVDKVGRRFPIVVAAPAKASETANEVALSALELVFTAFSQAWDADQLLMALNGIVADKGSPSVPSQSVWAIEGEDGTRIEMPGRFPEGLVERMLQLAA